MSQEFLTLDQLAERLQRDRRELEKLVQRGRIPGHRVEGAWRFHPTEVTQWLEQELRTYSDAQLAAVEESHRSQETSADFPVARLLHPETVQVPLDARTKRSVLESLIEVAGRTWQVWEPALLLDAIQQREDVMSTAFENGVALPHPRTPLPAALGESLIACGRTLSGIPFGAPRRGLTDIFFLVLCRDARTHLQVLARLARILQTPGFLEALRGAPDSKSSYDLICAADRQVAGDPA
jgi:PTS system nitrogen regulatory IIA component